MTFRQRALSLTVLGGMVTVAAAASLQCESPRGRRCSTAPLPPRIGKTVGVEDLAALADNERVVIPVVYHVLRMSGEQRVPLELAELQTKALNRGLRGTKISFVTRAVKDWRLRWLPGDPTFPNTRARPEVSEVAKRLEEDPEHVMNVYLRGDPFTNTASFPGESGWGDYADGGPASDSGCCQGIIMFWDYLPVVPELRQIRSPLLPSEHRARFAEGESLVHLVGHYLGLADTYNQFQEDPFGELTCDCAHSDDYVDDTPTQRLPPLRSWCRPRDSCPEFPGMDPLTNYMADEGDLCASEFSPGQVERMYRMVATFRRGLIVRDED